MPSRPPRYNTRSTRFAQGSTFGKKAGDIDEICDPSQNCLIKSCCNPCGAMTGEGGGGGDVMGGGDSKSGGGEKGGGGGDLMDCDPAQLCCNPLGPLFGGK